VVKGWKVPRKEVGGDERSRDELTFVKNLLYTITSEK